MKVVWLCHFVNQDMKECFNTLNLKEFAPWIDNLIKLFNNTDIELHIVAPNIFHNNKDTLLKKEGITYHFYKYSIINLNKRLNRIIYSILCYITNYFWIKHKIINCINKINPDIIHLHGAENPYYSAGILPLIDKYPVLTTIQGFISHTSVKNRLIKQRIKIEEEIINKCKYFGTRTENMNREILKINPKATLFFHNYPVTIPLFIKKKEEYHEFDIVFFARVCKDKGIEDLLKAVYLVKKYKHDVSLHIIGATGNSYKQVLFDLINELNIKDNVIFLGFMTTQQDIYKHCIKARMCVLPTYHDIIPGTVIESMLMKLPVIAYAVGGIPYINSKKENIVLVEKQNISQLADKILLLLNDSQKCNQLAESAYSFAIRNFNNDYVKKDILKAYSQIFKKEKSKRKINFL